MDGSGDREGKRRQGREPAMKEKDIEVRRGARLRGGVGEVEGSGDREGKRRQGREPAMKEKDIEVRRMFYEASSTLTFSPIYKDDWEAQVDMMVEEGIKVKKTEQRAGNFLVKEYLE